MPETDLNANVWANIAPEVMPVLEREAELAAEVHKRLGWAVGCCLERPIRLDERKILVINTAPVFPLQSPEFDQLPQELQDVVRLTHTGTTDPAYGSYADVITYSLGLELGDPRIEVWNLARESRPRYADNLFDISRDALRKYIGLVVTGSGWMTPDIEAGGITGKDNYARLSGGRDIDRLIRLRDFAEEWRHVQSFRQMYGNPTSPSDWKCFGNQALARISGEPDTIAPLEGGSELGIVTVTLNESAKDYPLLATLGQTATLAVTRTLCVAKLPKGAQALAGYGRDPNAIIGYPTKLDGEYTRHPMPNAIGNFAHSELWGGMLLALGMMRGVDIGPLVENLKTYNPAAMAETKLAIHGQFLEQAGKSYDFIDGNFYKKF